MVNSEEMWTYLIHYKNAVEPLGIVKNKADSENFCPHLLCLWHITYTFSLFYF